MAIASISLAGINVEAFQFPFKLASAIAAADVGKAVSLDTGAANTVKLAADDEEILGVLQTYENRAQVGEGEVGTVGMKGGFKLLKTGAVTVGQQVVGSATPGVVKGIAMGVGARNIVVEVSGNYATVIFF